MESKIQIYNKDGLGEIRVQKDEEEMAWFCARDLCKSLGYTNPQKAINDHLEEEEVTKRYLLTKGGRQQALFVNESGMYALIFGSKKENARAFRKWVTKEVLPSLRKTGKYEKINKEQNQKLLEEKKEIEIELIKAQEDNFILIGKLERKEKEERENNLRKFLSKYHKILNSEYVLIRDMAKILRDLGHEIGNNELYAWMRDWAYLGYEGDNYNQPNQMDLDNGLFRVFKRSYQGRSYYVTMLTIKGQIEIIESFEKNKSLPKAGD